MFVNTMPRYEILSADPIAMLDRGWRRPTLAASSWSAPPRTTSRPTWTRARSPNGTSVDQTLPPERLAEAGRDVEAQVLARAVTWHAEHHLLNEGRSIVFP
jgi:hypothetical protein